MVLSSVLAKYITQYLQHHQLVCRMLCRKCKDFMFSILDSKSKKNKEHTIQDTTVHKSTFKNIGRCYCGRFYKEMCLTKCLYAE